MGNAGKKNKILLFVAIFLSVFILLLASYNSGYKYGYVKGAVDMNNYIYEQVNNKPTTDYCEHPYYKENSWYCTVTLNGR